VAFHEVSTPEDREIAAVVSALRATADQQPLLALLRRADAGPERARRALVVLGELDIELLAQVALDALLDAYVENSAVADRPRGQLRGDKPRGGLL
jgi:hypothetical protein